MEIRGNPFFPLFVDMTGRRVLVVGGGGIAERRIKALVRFGADITLLSPEATEELEKLAALGAISWVCREYAFGDAERMAPFLIVAVTDCRDVNHAVRQEAAALGVLAIIADSRGECSCWFPALAEDERYIVGLVSKAGDHAAARKMAEKIREVLSESRDD